MNKKNYLIAGGSSGIGLEVVKMLDERQQTVYIGSRSVPGLSPFTNVHHPAMMPARISQNWLVCRMY
jgi:short-subunit dehydrogenase involved in D-alanine esterification of teichoic acids